MPWFRNHYVCVVCDGHWLAEAAEAAPLDCPHCRAYDVVPYRSDDRTRRALPRKLVARGAGLYAASNCNFASRA